MMNERSVEALAVAPRLIPLDEPSEGLLIWEKEGLPQTDYGAFSLRGPCDVEALGRALVEAQEGSPTFHAHLVPLRPGPWTTFGWAVRERPAELEVRDFTSLPELPADLESWIHEQMAGAVDHVQDLRAEYPVRFILFRLPEQRHILVFLFHHAATDGGGLYDFLQRAFRIYHRLVTGREPEWAGVAGMHAQAGDVRPVTPISGWRLMREVWAEWRRYPPLRTVQLASRPGAPGRIIRRYLVDDPALQRALRERARRDGGTLSDLFLAASKLALEEFNAARGAPHEIMFHGLAVNQRLRRPPGEIAGQGNPMSGIAIPTDPADRRDPQALLRLVIAERKRRMECGYDVWLARIGRWLTRAGRLLPVRVRYPVLRAILDQRLSFFVTNLGVIWPRMVDGRPTGETAIREVGGMELLDVHSSVGSTEKNAAAVILRTFQGRLYAVFLFGRHRVAEEDAAAFSELVMARVRDYL